MFEIIKKEKLAENIYWMDVYAPRVANSAKPGQFVIIKMDEYSERIPLTIVDYDSDLGVVSVVIQIMGKSTKKMVKFNKGDYFLDFAGPLGNPSDLVKDNKDKNILFIAGGLGSAPIYPQVKYLHKLGIKTDVIMGSRNKELLILEDKMKEVSANVYISTDDGSLGFKGNVTLLLKDLVEKQNKKYDEIIAIGPMIMMKYVCMTSKELNIPTIVSMNPIMVDGTGMCGACRISVDNQIKFACVDGPEFDGHKIDFDEALRRLQLYKTEEGKLILEEETKQPIHAENCNCKQVFDNKKRVKMQEQDPLVRSKNFLEVGYGYSLEEAMKEADRCYLCKNAKCITGCPVNIDIPKFIEYVKNGNIEKAAEVISKNSSLPAVCGRVCPQETQCEGVCIKGIKDEPIAIGRLERFVGDYAIKNNLKNNETMQENGKKVAVVGAGPAGLACASDLARLGYSVKIFEILHEPGGVLVYGIPEFRLPKKEIVDKEIQNVIDLGVEIETNVVIGRTITIDNLLEKEGYEAVFVGSGAGLPNFMNIKGENANGVFSANEYLTRANLMKAYSNNYDTPIISSKKVAVIGGGNVAMDAARTALRLGAEVHIVYRRSFDELPARLEEIHHALEEGIIFDLLTNPIEILTDNEGWVRGMRCVKMELGEPDASGRRSPKVIENSEFEMEFDTVLMSLGTSPNPLISSTTNELKTNKWGCIITGEKTETTKKGVFAGGDAVTGAATVIQAMGAGKQAAIAINEYLSK